MQENKKHTPTPSNPRHDLHAGATRTSAYGSRRETEKNHSRAQGPGYDFLNEEFKDIELIDTDPLFSESNYLFLYKSAQNYSGLLGKEFPVEYSPKHYRKLYDEFEKLMPGKHRLSLSEEDDKLHFTVSQPCYENTLFFIPCEILDHTEDKFRNILLDFFRIIKATQNLTPMKESYHVEGLFQELDVYMDEGADDKYIELLKSYNDGDISDILESINEIPSYTPYELQKIISEYNPASEKEKELLGLINEGLVLMEPEIPVFNYAKAFDFDPDAGYNPLTADELIMIIYGDDYVVEQMIESINVSCQECESELFCSGDIDLTPETTELMEKSEFVEKFLDWLLRICAKLYEYVD